MSDRTHPEEIQAEIELLTKELERTTHPYSLVILRDRLTELENELAGYLPFK